LLIGLLPFSRLPRLISCQTYGSHGYHRCCCGCHSYIAPIHVQLLLIFACCLIGCRQTLHSNVDAKWRKPKMRLTGSAGNENETPDFGWRLIRQRAKYKAICIRRQFIQLAFIWSSRISEEPFTAVWCIQFLQFLKVYIPDDKSWW